MSAKEIKLHCKQPYLIINKPHLKIVIALFFVISFSLVYSQNNFVDVEKKGEALFFNDMKLSLKYADSILNTNREDYKAYGNYLKGKSLFYYKHIDSAEVYIKKAIKFAKKQNSNDLWVRAQLSLGGIKIHQVKNEEAKSLIFETDNIPISNVEVKAEILAYKCLQNWYEFSNFQTCTDYLYQALTIHNDIKTETTKAIYLYLSEIFSEVGLYDSGIVYVNDVIEQSKKEKNNFFLGWAYSIKGLLLYENGGVPYAKKAIDYANASNNLFEAGHMYYNLALINTHQEIKAYDEAHQLYILGKEKHQEINLKSGLALAYLKMARLFADNFKHQDSAIYYNNKLRAHVKKSRINNYNYYIYNCYYNIYKLSKDYEVALKYKDSAEYEWDNIYGLNISSYIAKSERDYKLKDKEIKILQKDLELQKKQSQTKLMTGLTIFLLLISLLTWILFKQRQKRKDQEIVTLKREQQVKTLELLMEGEEKERLRIAKELHDGVNVDLSSIKYKLTSLLEKNNVVINEAVAMIDKSCEQVRAISHNLVPPSLKDFSLVDAIEDYCSTMNNLHNPGIVFNTIGDPITIPKKAEINIFRIVQELVNNSVKHAEATEVDVQISFQNRSIQLTIEDNGKGFDKDAVSKGIGLQNIQSRVDYLQAKLDFRSDSNGTSYLLDINTETLN